MFLGYSLRDWNLRVILNKIWDSQRVGYNHWAIQLHPADVDERFWIKRTAFLRGELPAAAFEKKEAT